MEPPRAEAIAFERADSLPAAAPVPLAPSEANLPATTPAATPAATPVSSTPPLDPPTATPVSPPVASRPSPLAAAEPADPPPWWIYPVFGVFAVAIAVVVFLFSTRCCACETRAPAQAIVAVPEEEAKPFAAPELQATPYVLSWMGDAAPTQALKLHFLLATAPYTTYSCDARSTFGVHGRVRVTLPKGTYAVRAAFGDGTQTVAHDVPPHALVTLTETTMQTQAVDEPLSASEVPAGVCVRNAP